MNVYHDSVWFSENSITNIIALSNLRLRYLITYRSNKVMLIVRRESGDKLNVQFIMHDSGVYYFDPRDQKFTFVSTVSEKK